MCATRRELVFCCERLNAVVLKQRTVPSVGAALQHGVSGKTACAAILGRRNMRDDAVFLDGVGRDRCNCTAAAVHTSAALALVVVVHALHEEVASTGAGAVHGCAAARAAIRRCAGGQGHEGVLGALFQRRGLPHRGVDQLGDRRRFRLHLLHVGRGRDFDRIDSRAYLQGHVGRQNRAHGGGQVLDFGRLEARGGGADGIAAGHGERVEAVAAVIAGHYGALKTCALVAQGYGSAADHRVGGVGDDTGESTQASLGQGSVRSQHCEREAKAECKAYDQRPQSLLRNGHVCSFQRVNTGLRTLTKRTS